MAYVYRHIRLDKNEPFYIGVGGLGEFDSYARSRELYNRNIIWKRIVDRTKYEIEIILDDVINDKIFEKEKEFIKLYGRIDKKTGILANMTDGGDGTSGFSYSFTQQHKNKIRDALKGRKRPKEVVDKFVKTRKERGYKASEETLKKMSEATRGNKNPFYGKKHTIETKLKTSKLVLNLENGIFYNSAKEACYTSLYKYDYFKQMLRNDKRNKTNFIYC